MLRREGSRSLDQNLKGEDVVRILNNIVAIRGKPMTIKTDNGSEFISKVMEKWAYERGVELDFSRPGKPTDNQWWKASMDGCAKNV